MKIPKPLKKIYDAFDKPRKAKTVHGWLSLLLIVPGIPIAYFFRESTAFVVLLSMLALIIGEVVAWGDNGNVVDERKKK